MQRETDYRITKRAKRCWERLHGFYGSTLTEKFGDLPPPEWCEMIDDLTNDQLKRALSIVRTENVSFPPSLPEFEKAAKPPNKPVAQQGPTTQQRLCEYVMRHKALTQKQARGPWTYLYRELITPEFRGGELKDVKHATCTGVVIPADGESPCYRVMLMDLELEAA